MCVYYVLPVYESFKTLIHQFFDYCFDPFMGLAFQWAFFLLDFCCPWPVSFLHRKKKKTQTSYLNPRREWG